eukprot:CAMPEP_0184695090 /NCGR_PEP_ID=MMETSP0313-20130426/2838_1 /TAXON_ID=2792 /ORGANISM="Porphyridium aerugineum, Strain SAG 1380-2" /LENGTH=181 /DNA_ID=CAMNT_0027153483 /DNA_START=89 /DNA_END=634 /DNA_ORIENTATION=-
MDRNQRQPELAVAFLPASMYPTTFGKPKLKSSFLCSTKLNFKLEPTLIRTHVMNPTSLYMKWAPQTPKYGFEPDKWERADYGFGDHDEETASSKLPSIPRNKMKEWCRTHGCSFRTECTMRPQRHFAKPWFCSCVVRSERKVWKTIGDATSKLKSVDVAINKMYRLLLKEPEFKRFDDPLF